MEGFKTKIEKLVISQPLAQRLVALGLHKSAVHHYFNDIDFDIEGKDEEVKKWRLADENIPDYPDEDFLPAWTTEELRIMIGWFNNGCDLREPRPKPMPREEIQFVNYFKSSMKNYESSAEGNGEWLEWLIQQGNIMVEDANERYKEKYKPE